MEYWELNSSYPIQMGNEVVVTGAGEPVNPWESQIYDAYLAQGGNPYDYARPGFELQ